jgi:3-dehydroquinate synthase
MKTVLKTSQIQQCEVLSSMKMLDSIHHLKDKFVICISDENVYALYQDRFPSKNVIVLESGEKAKSIETVINVISKLTEFESDRNSFIVGIGGGVICDITGFVSSIYMRGVSFGFIPTTLLALVDASIGGKNGINYNGIKNLVGCINQPSFVLCDTLFLNSLQRDEYIAAFAEIIKYALIKDFEFFRFLEDNVDKILSKEPDFLREVINKSVQIKCDIVKMDTYENNQRVLLNFGHTFGHAIEILQSIRHGEAISIGMIIAMKISVFLGHLSQNKYQRVRNLLTLIGLPLESELGINDYLKIIQAEVGQFQQTL